MQSAFWQDVGIAILVIVCSYQAKMPSEFSSTKKQHKICHIHPRKLFSLAELTF